MQGATSHYYKEDGQIYYEDVLLAEKLTDGFAYKEPILYAVPVLSFLIKECGNNFLNLQLNMANCEDKDWLAEGALQGSSILDRGTGDSPEEAVARLWIALNNSSS